MKTYSKYLPHFLLLVLVTFCTYLPALDNDFVNWDDDAHVTQNPFIRDLDAAGMKNIFLSQVNGTYIPLTLLTFALEYHFFRDDPFIYHLNNVLLHVAVTVLVFYFGLLCGLSVAGAFVAALIFGVHPMHVESVAWVTERKDVLFSFFYMAVLCGYVHYIRKIERDGYWKLSVPAFAGMAFLAVLSVLAKSMAVSLVGVMIFMDWYFKRPVSARSVKEKLYVALLTVPIAWTTCFMNAAALGPLRPGDALLGIWSGVFYLRKFFYPSGYTLFFPGPQERYDYGPDLLICLGLLILLIRLKKRRLLIFAFLFYGLTILPVLRLAETGAHASRFIYLPSVGLSIFMGGLAGWFWARAKCRLSRVCAGIVLLTLTGFLIMKTAIQVDV